MIRIVGAAVLACLGAASQAQDFTGLARLDVTHSVIEDSWGKTTVDLFLSQPVPWRVFTLDDPRRLVLDFREIDWRGADKATLDQSDRVSDLRFGALRPGWSRMVVDLSDAMIVSQAGMQVNTVDGTARLTVNLSPSSDADYAAAAGAPSDPGWDMLNTVDPTAPPITAVDDGILTVVIDPGHGGIDPGAERDGLREADLMLQLAVEVAQTMNRMEGMRAVLTRQTDVFVPLEERISIARRSGADVLLSLHADALDGDEITSGASVYTLSDQAQEDASLRMAERHDRGDLLAGLDLTGQDDTVATVLMDLARTETAPQSDTLADALVQALMDTSARVNNTPRREALLAVLNAADFPSALVEVGFLSNPHDRDALRSAEGRARVVAGIVLAVQRWANSEAAKDALRRQ